MDARGIIDASPVPPKAPVTPGDLVRKRVLEPAEFVAGEHDLVVVAVKVAFKSQQLRLSRKGSRQTNAMHRGFRARTGETYLFEARNGVAQQFGQLGV